MRVRSLQTFINDNHLAGEVTVESLRGIRLGVDAVYWFRTIQMLKDPFADALGGCPPGLFNIIAAELDNFAKYGIHPVFVFEGMVPTLGHEHWTNAQSTISEGWTNLSADKNDVAAAQRSFAQGTSRINNDLVHFVFHYLKGKGCDVIRAPYLCGAQLAYMCQHNQLQAVLGQPGLMMYDIKKVICVLDFAKKSAQWVDLGYLLQYCAISQAEFVECCLLAGTEFSVTYPFLDVKEVQGLILPPNEKGQPTFKFEQVLAMTRQTAMRDWMGCIPKEEMRADHIEGYCITKALVLYSPVLNMKDSSVEPLSSPPPSDLYKVIGNRLPNNLYALIASGLVNCRLPHILSLGEWNDKHEPLVDSEEYRALLIDLTDYRKKALAMLAEGSGLSGRKVVIKNYFDKPTAKPKTISVTNSDKLTWSFTKQELMQEMKAQNVEHVDIKFCIKWHAKDYEQNGPLTRHLKTPGAAAPKKPEDLNMLAAHTILNLLESLDYFAPDGGMTVLGDVLKDTRVPIQEQVLLALELLKLGVLTGEPLEPVEGKPYPPALKYPESEVRDFTLLTRVFSLMPMKLKGELWHGTVDFDLAGFHCLVRVVNRSLRSLVEGSLAVHLLKDMRLAKLLPPHAFSPNCPIPTEYASEVKIVEGAGPVSTLPSFMLPRTCLGIVCKWAMNYEGDAKSFESNLKKTFSTCVDPLRDLKTGIKFWKELLRCVNVMSEQLGAEDIHTQMLQADRVLQDRLKVVGVAYS